MSHQKENLIELTKKIYHLTLLFPKKEPLRYKVREVADHLLQKLISGRDSGNVWVDFEVLDSFLEVAKWQNWVSPNEILSLQKEYNQLRDELKKEKPKVKEITQNIKEEKLPNLAIGITERQEKILSFLKENGRAQVWQLKKIFPEVSKRTLRRDFNKLLKRGMIERIGERNNTFYQIKIS